MGNEKRNTFSKTTRRGRTGSTRLRPLRNCARVTWSFSTIDERNLTLQISRDTSRFSLCEKGKIKKAHTHTHTHKHVCVYVMVRRVSQVDRRARSGRESKTGECMISSSEGRVLHDGLRILSIY